MATNEERLDSLEAWRQDVEYCSLKNRTKRVFGTIGSFAVAAWPTIKAIGPWVLVAAMALSQYGCPYNPNPGPNPPPTPDVPVFPASTFQLELFAWQTATNTVPDAQARKNGAVAIINAMRGVVAQISAGTVRNLEDILKQTAAANRTELGKANIPVAQWDAFFTALQDKLYNLYSTDKMRTADDFKEAWNEIIRGLESIK